MSRQDASPPVVHVSRAALIARGHIPPPLSPPAANPEVVTRGEAHIAFRGNEKVFSDAASPPAGTRLDASERHEQADTGIAAPASDLNSEPPRTFGQKFADWFHYETEQMVRLHNKKASLIFRAAQLLILGYIIFGLVWKKGYQKTAEGHGTSATKIKGVAFSNSSQSWLGPDALPQFQIFDSYDLVNPVLEDDCFFVTTNMWMTLNQTRKSCVSFDKTNMCSQTPTPGGPALCKKLGMVPSGAGRQWGPDYCMINSTDSQQLWPTPSGGYCMMFGWCPAEMEQTGPSNAFRLQGVENFTVFSRITVRYPLFGVVMDNVEGSTDQLTQGVNSWTLEQLVQEAGYEWKDVNTTGVLLAMNANFDCDLDKNPDGCNPTITITRMDDAHSSLSKGYNFRTAEFTHDKWGSRQLTKRYGLRLIVLMNGVAARFEFVALLTAIGAGIGLLTVATLVADMIATKVREWKWKKTAVFEFNVES
jgi:P2X purinoceptor 4